jgi:O-antigen/teichoic acid export membrane protein
MVMLRFVLRGIGLASTIVLARLLVPGDFGLVAVATSFVALLEALSEFSFDMALIRHQNADRRHYDTAWTLAILRGVLTGLVVFAVAAPVARWFDEPRLTDVLYVFAALAVLTGFENVGVVQFRKELRFDQEFKLAMVGRIGSFLVTIALAFWLRNYWALVAGIIAGRLLGLVAGYVMQPFRPRLSLAVWRDLIGFSKWMLLGGILNFVTTRIDTFIIGKVAGVQVTGLYQIAYEISNLPATELVAPISRATYPAFSKLADNLSALTRAFLESLGMILTVSLPAVTGIALTADLVVDVFLGPKWADAATIIRILALYGAIRVCFANTYSLILALNRPDTGTWLLAPTLAVLIPALLWWTPEYGGIGAAWALVAAGAVTLVLNTLFTLRLLHLPARAFFSYTWRPVLACAVLAIAVLLFREYSPAWLSPAPHFVQLFVIAGVGAATYATALLMLWWIANRPEGVEATLLRLARSRTHDMLYRLGLGAVD